MPTEYKDITKMKHEEYYRDTDLPFCCRCERYMESYVGRIRINMSTEDSDKFVMRCGVAYKCPECGATIIYKWVGKTWEWSREEFLNFINNSGKWCICMEHHHHHNKKRAEQTRKDYAPRWSG